MLLFCIAFSGLQAQNSLFIEFKTGKDSVFQIKTLRSLSFLSGNLMLKKTDGSINSYLYTSFSKLFFDSKVIVGVIENEVNKLSIFPSPATNQLNIQYWSAGIGQSEIQIIDLNGRTVMRKMIVNDAGFNKKTLEVSTLQQGFYFCRINTGSSIEISKFIKSE
jgi:hypothetical protein